MIELSSVRYLANILPLALHSPHFLQLSLSLHGTVSGLIAGLCSVRSDTVKLNNSFMFMEFDRQGLRNTVN